MERKKCTKERRKRSGYKIRGTDGNKCMKERRKYKLGRTRK